ncbi:pyridoxamine 5'-phosphate oxidase family protein [Jiangella rhizosphaerae]|uniref:pyridoxamine 5'-phosphate oxidase family protein n=1 Tax=Jiangella rhizosphaerae TaxID=2293569 RepID=UPI0018F5A7C5|nr:pyridoxamine 5'-phosphate oxidase family protein [Jiangella rhizosphaerae]
MREHDASCRLRRARETRPAVLLRLAENRPDRRIVFTEGALPAIEPVNFVLDGEDVIIRTGMGSKLAQAARSAVVAFEGDQYDETTLTGWSVVFIGRAEAVGHESERRRLATLGLTPWALGGRPHYIRIRPEIVRGRRIPPRRAAV